MQNVERFLFIVSEVEGSISQYARHPVDVIELFARRSLFFLGCQESEASRRKRRQISLQEVEVYVALATQQVKVGVFSRPKQLIESKHPDIRVAVIIVQRQPSVMEVEGHRISVETAETSMCLIDVSSAKRADAWQGWI